jgi:hypothetical protein
MRTFPAGNHAHNQSAIPESGAFPALMQLLSLNSRQTCRGSTRTARPSRANTFQTRPPPTLMRCSDSGEDAGARLERRHAGGSGIGPLRILADSPPSPLALFRFQLAQLQERPCRQTQAAAVLGCIESLSASSAQCQTVSCRWRRLCFCAAPGPGTSVDGRQQRNTTHHALPNNTERGRRITTAGVYKLCCRCGGDLGRAHAFYREWVPYYQ